jgi:hypothetical protein
MSKPLSYAELENAYDGPIPQEAIDLARGPARIRTQLVNAEIALGRARDEVSAQIRKVIRPRRANGTFHPYMLSDLRLYVGMWREKLRPVLRLRAELNAEVARFEFSQEIDPRDLAAQRSAWRAA